MGQHVDAGADRDFAEAPIGGAPQKPIRHRNQRNRAGEERNPDRHVRQIERQAGDHVGRCERHQRQSKGGRHPAMRQRTPCRLPGPPACERQPPRFSEAPAHIILQAPNEQNPNRAGETREGADHAGGQHRTCKQREIKTRRVIGAHQSAGRKAGQNKKRSRGETKAQGAGRERRRQGDQGMGDRDSLRAIAVCFSGDFPVHGSVMSRTS